MNLYRDNSFEKLQYLNYFLIMVSEYKIKETLSLLFLWNPTKLSLWEKDKVNYILITPLNSFQILTLMEKNIPIYYLNENKNFIPWNFSCREKEEPFTIIFPDGRKFIIDLDKFQDYESIIKFKFPKTEIKKAKGKEIITLDIRLIDSDTLSPSLFLLNKNEYKNLIKILNLNFPWDKSYEKYEFLYFSVDEDEYFIIKADKDSFEDLNDKIKSISIKSFYHLYPDFFYVEEGKIPSPLFDFGVLKQKYFGYKIFLFEENGKTKSFFFSIEDSVFISSGELPNYFPNVFEKELKEFLK